MTKVFLSAGHGGNDPGAVGNGLKEKDINLTIMLSCSEYLNKHGVSTIVSRTKDENDPVTDEVREANASGAKVAVSFHTNAGGGDGSESLYHSYSKEGKKLAELCEKHVKAIGQNSRGIKERDDLWFLRGTNMTSVLCECGFIDNKKDKEIIDTKDEQKAFGIAYAKAILDYLGIDYKETPITSKTIYKVQVGAYKSKSNAYKMLDKVKKASFSDAVITVSNGVYHVQIGAYKSKKNAKSMLEKVKNAGFKDAIIKNA